MIPVVFGAPAPRIGFVLSLLLVLAAPRVGAEEGREPHPAPPPPGAAEVVAMVVAAHEAGDQTRLAEIATDGRIEWWYVTERLCAAGAHDAAAALAKHFKHADLRNLTAYIDRRRKDPLDPALLSLMEDVSRARKARDLHKALKLTDALPENLHAVATLVLASWRATDLQNARRLEESEKLAVRGAEAATGLGWNATASEFLRTAGTAAWYANDRPRALAHWERAYAAAEVAESQSGRMLALMNLGVGYRAQGRPDDALANYEKALAIARDLGDTLAEANLLNNIGSVHQTRGLSEAALRAFEESERLKAKLPDRRNHAMTLSNLGGTLLELNRIDEARATLERALRMSRETGDESVEALALGSLGRVLSAECKFQRAIDMFKASLAIQEGRNDLPAMANSLGRIGDAYGEMYELDAAAECFERAGRISERLEDPWGQLGMVRSLARLRGTQGKFAESLTLHQDALRRATKLGAMSSLADARIAIARIRLRLGQEVEALSDLDAAEDAALETGAPGLVAAILGMRARVHWRRGELSEAVRIYEELLHGPELFPDNRAITLTLLGSLLSDMGAFDEALRRYDESLKLAEALEIPDIVSGALENRGVVLARLGRLEASLPAFEAALDTAPDPEARSHAMVGIAQVHLSRGEHAKALAWAERAIELVQGFGRGLADEEESGLRHTRHGPFDVALLAASAQGDPAQTLRYLETGRARVLLDTLHARDTLRAALVPPALARAVSAAEAAMAGARDRLAAARRSRNRRAMRAASEQLASARRKRAEAVAEVRRQSRIGAELVDPQPVDLADLQKALQPGDALVFYAITRYESLALVVRHDGARVVPLGESEAIEAAVDGVLRAEPPYIEMSGAADLAQRLVEPLKLKPAVDRILVSPSGRLGFLPFGVLWPDKDVCYVPSGSVLALLKTAASSGGTEVFGLGAPNYAGTAYDPLPATQAEVEDLAGRTLFGDAATVEGVRAAFAKGNAWRAVHFACHGVIDPTSPLLSRLVLTGGELYAQDVFQMRIPADLAVLSACETGRGRVYRAEGIVGLTRAFMYAGAPRVLCSLWKVDDEATRALMVRFYELWNPKEGEGLGAAAALRKAQEYVRTYEPPTAGESRPRGRLVRPGTPAGKTRGSRPWEHPYYWAAWVLWGLPD